MKIQCDVCEKEASVFCTADEASLCDACDRRVHHANKLASKHPRFSLLHPSFQDSPLCDICQERKAYLFCKEDRAILCRECDIPIHNANSHTKNHNRFLLSGVKLSSSTSTYSSPSYQTPTYSSNGSNACCTQETDAKSSDSKGIYRQGSTEMTLESSTPISTMNHDYQMGHDGDGDGDGDGGSSRISDFLMETYAEWHVDDFLDPSQTSNPYGFCKAYDSTTTFTTNPESSFGCFLTDMEIWGHTSMNYDPQSRIGFANNGGKKGSRRKSNAQFLLLALHLLRDQDNYVHGRNCKD